MEYITSGSGDLVTIHPPVFQKYAEEHLAH